MTGLLKETFAEEAEAIGDPNLDLDAIVAIGNRRIKRRRLAVLITAVAAGAAMVAGGVTVVQQLGGGSEAPVVSAELGFKERRPSWADGNEIHFGSEVLRVRSAISSFVQTDVGFAYAGADGSVYRVVGRGTQLIGKGNNTHLLAVDPDRALVGWVDATPKVPEFVLYDLAGDREVARTATGNKAGAATADVPVRVAAIDDGVAYFGASDGLRRWTIATGKSELIKPKAAPTFVQAADAGQIVWEHTAAGKDTELAIGPDVNAPAVQHIAGWRGNLSPQARYLLTDKADVVRLANLQTGHTATVTIPDYQLIVPTQWQGTNTFYAAGFRPEESAPLDLLTCTITPDNTTTCKVAVPHFAPPITNNSTTQFPVGVPIQQ
ncbi:hypothetical protein [Kribbella sp. NPDC023855]|uniref:hypothetical protein n=1 Tax=Kribbella sp. NPDC023855 TaxID=3154698 RepID=UPI0033DF97B6